MIILDSFGNKFGNAVSFFFTWFIISLTLSYMGGVVGGGGHKVPMQISKICIFATNTATAIKFGDFS